MCSGKFCVENFHGGGLLDILVSVSESVSSNEYPEDTSPHVPVIRNTRAPQTNSSGDTVKARQARLARDLSNSRYIIKSISSSF